MASSRAGCRTSSRRALAGGCPLTDAQTAALEQRAAEAYAFGLDVAPPAQREAAAAAADLAWDAWRNR